MSRFQGGWIKVSRAAICGDIGSSSFRLSLFIKLCAWATLQETTIIWAGIPRAVPAGSVLTAFRELSDELGCDRKTAKKHLAYLQMRGAITVETSNFGILVFLSKSNDNELLDEGVARGMDRGMARGMDRGMDRGMARAAPLIEEVKKERRENTCTAVSQGEPGGAIPELSGNALAEGLLRKVKPKIQATWLAVYSDPDWIKQEVLKAAAWCVANPQRAPKSNYASFMTNWLSKGWERHRKSIPSGRSSVGQIQSVEQALEENS